MNLLRPISVVLADDHAMVRQSLARVLDSVAGIRVVGQAGDGPELKRVVAQTKPDCLVMDHTMPEHDPVQAIRNFREIFPQLKILVLTVHENVQYAVRLLQVGAHGYLIKSAAVEELVDGIKGIYNGEVYVSKKIAQQVWSQLLRPKDRREGIESLSQREFEVLRILGSGKSLQQCASQLEVSVSTVSTYRARLLEKLSLSTTGDLVRFAIEHKIA